MQLFFLIPLTTGLISGYLFKKCADEMAYLTGVIAIVCFILSLVLAPWQLQITILVLVFGFTRRLLQQNQARLEFKQHQPEQRSNESLASEEIIGQYRGATWKSSKFQQAQVLPPHCELKYRGTSIIKEENH